MRRHWGQEPVTNGYRTDCGVERIAKIGEGYTDAAGTFHTGTEIEVTYPELGTTVYTEPGLDHHQQTTMFIHGNLIDLVLLLRSQTMPVMSALSVIMMMVPDVIS